MASTRAKITSGSCKCRGGNVTSGELKEGEAARTLYNVYVKSDARHKDEAGRPGPRARLRACANLVHDHLASSECKFVTAVKLGKPTFKGRAGQLSLLGQFGTSGGWFSSSGVPTWSTVPGGAGTVLRDPKRCSTAMSISLPAGGEN